LATEHAERGTTVLDILKSKHVAHYFGPMVFFRWAQRAREDPLAQLIKSNHDRSKQNRKGKCLARSSNRICRNLDWVRSAQIPLAAKCMLPFKIRLAIDAVCHIRERFEPLLVDRFAAPLADPKGALVHPL
jgi:hypothetical protein